MKMTAPTPHTDIVATGWIKYLPVSIKPYAFLMRLDRPIGIWLLLLPSLWAIFLSPTASLDIQTAKTVCLFALGAILMRGAGCIINDLWDKDFDKAVERTKNRPLASGAISTRNAVLFLGVLLSLSLVILTQFNLYTVILGVLSLIPVILYPAAKRVTWYPQAVLGLTFNIGALMGATAMSDGAPPTYSWALYVAGLFWTLAYDTIYAQQDMADDALIGIKSTALKFGTHIKSYVGLFYCMTAYFIYLSTFLAHMPISSGICILFCCSHLLWQYVSWNNEDPASSLLIFKSNKDFGLLIALTLFLFVFLRSVF
ncbi:MAG TPA: 4-hydroxybenzoate octaprenyltransferase [Alphaproteobacteria bacterium]|nr:4-hydroxybenzoate octaprenyltransferase [Alphaproteobacteria bacterium]